jgi:hypothetical protein
VDRRLREEYGVYIDFIPPVLWNDRKVRCLGSGVYLRPPNETFHEFLIHVLCVTLGKDWRATHAALPAATRHVVVKCLEDWDRWKALNADADVLARDGHHSAAPSGWVQYLISLAWDLATVLRTGALPNALLDRLRDMTAFQGARYELAVAAIFGRLNCEIRFLDEDPGLRSEKHVEFVATHRPTGQEIAVEAKSRHRAGVLHQHGERDDDDPLRGDAKGGVRRLFMKAMDKAPAGTPYMVFIDINAPVAAAEVDARWKTGVQAWISGLRVPTADAPDEYNALYVTNFSPHYDGADLSTGVAWLSVIPLYARTPAAHDLTTMLQPALSNYANVPAYTVDGQLLG